jgi:hypothetical protein
MTDAVQQDLSLTCAPGSLPEAPLAMPAQVLERAEGGLFALLFRLRPAQAAKTGH